MKRISVLLFLIIAFVCVPIVSSAKVGLVLGGGGAKGAAHIGALKVIEKTGVKIDYISGTSIGAVIGGLYAAGYSVSELERLFLNELDFLGDNNLENTLNRLLRAKGVRNFSDTKIPFRCVAVDMESMTEVVLKEGLLSRAIYASMTVPGVYEPVEYSGKKLFDGGLLNNLPVDVAKAMGADAVIAIDLQSGEGADMGYSIRTGSGLIGNLVNWAMRRPDNTKYLANIEAAKVYINPDLRLFKASSFGRNNLELIMEIGEDEATKHINKILGLIRR